MPRETTVSGTGSCLCGDIRWEVSGALSEMAHCHCSMCRKVHGTAFATYGMVERDEFRWRSGEHEIRHFTSAPGFDRPFCGRCGSALPGAAEAFEGELGVPVGALEGSFQERPRCHIFVASKAPWHDIGDELPRYPAFEPESEQAEVQPPFVAVPVAGKISGSCLCGGVAYAIDGVLTGIVNCHCSRCRRARAAAHGSNAFTTPNDFHWLRGEERVLGYSMPDADVFGQSFCATCGSAMPRVSRDRVVVPAGSLDGDPGVRAGVHIFWGSKARWFDTMDDLPRFDTTPG